MPGVDLTLVPQTLRPDASRVVARPFIPGSPAYGQRPNRIEHILRRVERLSEGERQRLLDESHERSADKFGDLEAIWREHFEIGRSQSAELSSVSDDTTRRLMGALLTQGYAYEAVALTNPSIVAFGDRVDGAQPFVLSARAIGEGHISSIAFITGEIGRGGRVSLDERHPHVSNGRVRQPSFDKTLFAARLEDVSIVGGLARRVLEPLPETFSAGDLHAAIGRLAESDIEPLEVVETTRRVMWVAASNYEVEFDSTLPVAEHLLSPASPVEENGMEDARFVRFVEDDGSVAYYATYTAYDGRQVLPQLIRTEDFHSFSINTLSGPAVVHQKGMAIFPRRIDGDLVALSRHDQEQIYVSRTRDVQSWSNAELVVTPAYSWEMVQLGNCGSPIETEAGWLVITHGVGPMRRYVLGAVLLDLDEPTRLLARLERPLLEPRPEDANGHVPNVVYSCGALLVDETLVLPFGFSDYGIRLATMPVSDVLNAMG